jgi:anti-anti-sigma factor
MGLSVLTKRPDVGLAVVTATGEIDLATGDTLLNEIVTVLALAEVVDVVVDLSGVTFLDSSGIGVLVRGRRLADENGKGFRVDGGTAMVREVLQLTGLWQHLQAGER